MMKIKANRFANSSRFLPSPVASRRKFPAIQPLAIPRASPAHSNQALAIQTLKSRALPKRQTHCPSDLPRGSSNSLVVSRMLRQKCSNPSSALRARKFPRQRLDRQRPEPRIRCSSPSVRLLGCVKCMSPANREGFITGRKCSEKCRRIKEISALPMNRAVCVLIAPGQRVPAPGRFSPLHYCPFIEHSSHVF
jgi:hypothetical protein